jgi:hypothetical protein
VLAVSLSKFAGVLTQSIPLAAGLGIDCDLIVVAYKRGLEIEKLVFDGISVVAWVADIFQWPARRGLPMILMTLSYLVHTLMKHSLPLGCPLWLGELSLG